MGKTLFSSFEPKGIIRDGDKRFKYIDVLYVIGILLVVWGHSHPISSDWYGTWYSHLNAFIYSFHMPLFFFIGGYLMVSSKSAERLGYFKWALGKILKFLIPYLILTVLAYYPKSLLGDTSDVVELSATYFLKTTFLIPRLGVWGHFWFIPTFLVLDLIWGAWRAYVNKNRHIYRIGLIGGSVISLLLAIFPILTDYFVLYDISQVAAFYSLGIFAALCKPFLWDKAWKNIIWLPICAIPTYFLYPYGNFTFKYSPILNGDFIFPYSDQRFVYFPYICFIVSLGCVWFCWNLAKLITNLKIANFFEKFTKYNFTIYLYSWPAQSLVDVMLRRLGVHWIAIVAVLFVIGFVVPTLIIVAYKRFTFLHCKFMDYLIGIQTK